MKSPIAEHWPTLSSSDLQSLWFSAAALVVLLFAIVFWQTKKRRHSKKSDEDSQFQTLCQELRLTPEETNEVAILAELIQKTHSETISSLYLFELAFQTRFGSKTAPSPAAIEHLESLRKKVGFDIIPVGQPLFSSRNLQPGQTASLVVASEDEESRTLCKVQTLTSQTVIIQPLEGSFPDLQVGDTVSLVAQQPSDGEYTFVLTVQQASDRNRLWLNHSLQFERKQARAYIRIETDAIAKFRFTVATRAPDRLKGGSRFEGVLCDLSGGGTLLESHERFDGGDRLIMSFIFQGESFYGIKAEILRVKERAANQDMRYLHQIRFVDMENNVREKLIKLIFAKHREEVQWQRTLGQLAPKKH